MAIGRLNSLLISWNNTNDMQSSTGIITHSMISGDISGWQIKLNTAESNITISELKIKQVPTGKFLYCYREKNTIYLMFDLEDSADLINQDKWQFTRKFENIYDENEDVRDFFEHSIINDPPEYCIYNIMNSNKISQLGVIDIRNCAWGTSYTAMHSILDQIFLINKTTSTNSLLNDRSSNSASEMVSHGYKAMPAKLIFCMHMAITDTYWKERYPMILYFGKDLSNATIMNIDKFLESCILNVGNHINIVRQGIIKKDNWNPFKLTITGNLTDQCFFLWGSQITEMDLSKLHYSSDSSNNKLPTIVTMYEGIEHSYNKDVMTGSTGPEKLILGNDCSHSTLNVICSGSNITYNKIRHRVIGSGTNAPKINLIISGLSSEYLMNLMSLSLDVWIKGILRWVFRDFHYDYCEELNLLLDKDTEFSGIKEYFENYLDEDMDKFISNCLNFKNPVKNFNIKYEKNI